MADRQTMVAEPQVETERQQERKPQKQPRYNVILWDDTDHSYDYVVLMMKRIFRLPIETGFQIAKEVDNQGRAICLSRCGTTAPSGGRWARTSVRPIPWGGRANLP